MTAEPKYTTLSPHWKYYAFHYFVGFLTIPLAGIGLIVIYLTWKGQNSVFYKITDHQIKSVDVKYHQTIDLANIEQVTVRQTWLNKRLEVGTIVLETPETTMELKGVQHPARLKTILDKAIDAEKARLSNKEEKVQHKQPEYHPGSMERMDYLTGLWQQGLLSDEDFQEEKKKFD